MSTVNESPINVGWFQDALDRLTRDRQIELRIDWMPRLNRSTMHINGENRVFKKYPASKQFGMFVKGMYFKRDGRVTGYQPRGGLVPPGVLPTDLAEPDYEYVQESIELFVIEQKMADVPARRLHAKFRKMCEAATGVDGFGEFPKEGWWNWFADISEHRDGCCVGVDNCRGRYREPDARDLDAVAQSLKFRDQWPQLRSVEQPPSRREIDQFAKAQTDAVLEWEEKNRLERIKELGEEIALGLRPMMTPSVYVDLRGVKNDSENSASPAGVGSSGT